MLGQSMPALRVDTIATCLLKWEDQFLQFIECLGNACFPAPTLTFHTHNIFHLSQSKVENITSHGYSNLYFFPIVSKGAHLFSVLLAICSFCELPVHFINLS